MREGGRRRINVCLERKMLEVNWKIIEVIHINKGKVREVLTFEHHSKREM